MQQICSYTISKWQLSGLEIYGQKFCAQPKDKVII